MPTLSGPDKAKVAPAGPASVSRGLDATLEAAPMASRDLGNPQVFPPPPAPAVMNKLGTISKAVKTKADFAAQFCLRRAGTGNNESTRALCNCVECDEGEQVLAELVRRSHKNPKLEEGVRLMFVVAHLNEAAAKFGIAPLAVIPVLPPPAPVLTRDFTFDCKLLATISVPGTSRENAERILRAKLDAAEVNAGCWDNGEPILFGISLDDGPQDLIEIDGDAI